VLLRCLSHAIDVLEHLQPAQLAAGGIDIPIQRGVHRGQQNKHDHRYSSTNQQEFGVVAQSVHQGDSRGKKRLH
jgi:hypothetical protein